MNWDDLPPQKWVPDGGTFAGALGNMLGGFTIVAAIFAFVGVALYFLAHWSG